MANATQRKQVPSVSTKITQLVSVISRKTPQLPGKTELHGSIKDLTYTGAGFDSGTAV